MKPIKLLAFDLDGTLLKGDKTISGYTCDVLRKCRERGILIAVATGRNAVHCERLLPFIRPDVFISNDGCLAKYRDKVLSRTVIKTETVNELLRRALANPKLSDIVVSVEAGDLAQSFIDPSSPLHIDYKNYTWLTDFSKGIDQEAYMVGMFCEIADAADKLTAGLSGIHATNPTGDRWYEIQPSSVNKGTALKAVAESLNIGADEIAAFGDEVNDLEMLRYAGSGVAMGNARETVKAAARYVCGTNGSDGAAKWIEEEILKWK